MIKTVEDWFDTYVPGSGKADTVGGEIVRAYARVEYRYYNDGDRYNVGYGKETVNNPMKYLKKQLGKKIKLTDFTKENYTNALEGLEYIVFDHLKKNPKLFETTNTEDSICG